jgi:hypothetical protein
LEAGLDLRGAIGLRVLLKRPGQKKTGAGIFPTPVPLLATKSYFFFFFATFFFATFFLAFFFVAIFSPVRLTRKQFLSLIEVYEKKNLFTTNIPCRGSPVAL